MTTGVDPALADRDKGGVVGIREGRLPVRTMTIANLEGTAEARILSRDRRGAVTRLARLPAGWGTREPGWFSEHVEVFVVSGEIGVGDVAVHRHGLAAFPAMAPLPGVTSVRGATVLLFTAAPVRYQPGESGDPGPQWWWGEAAPAPWEPCPHPDLSPGVLVKRLGPSIAGGAFTLQAAVHWRADTTLEATAGEDWFLLEGAATLREEDTTVDYEAGGYAYRPGGARHGGPGAVVATYALAISRTR